MEFKELNILLDEAIKEVLDETAELQSTPDFSQNLDAGLDGYTYSKKTDQSFQMPNQAQSELSHDQPRTYQSYPKHDTNQSQNKPAPQYYHQSDAPHAYQNTGTNQKPEMYQSYQKPDSYQRPEINQTYKNPSQPYQKSSSQSSQQPDTSSPYFDSYEYFKKTDESFQTGKGATDTQSYHKPETAPPYKKPEPYQHPLTQDTLHRRDESSNTSQTARKPAVYNTYKHPEKLAFVAPEQNCAVYKDEHVTRFVGPDKPPKAAQTANGKESGFTHEDVVGPNVIGRSVWGALPPMGTINPIEPPTKSLVFTLNTETPQCFTQKECCRLVRQIQAKHMGSGLPDIQHNFLMGGDGNLYEGRGWWQESGIQRDDGQGSNYNIAFIGDYKSDPSKIPKHMLLPVQDLIVYGNAIRLMEGGVDREVPENKVKPTPEVQMN